MKSKPKKRKATNFKIAKISQTLVSHKELVLLSLILIFALFLRVYALENAPFWVDESISSLVSKNILQSGLPLLGSGALYDRAFVFHYSQAISFAVFGISDFAARFPSVLFGVLTVLLAYLIGKEYSKKAGLIAAIFCATFFIEVFFSRQARFYQLFQFAFFASIYLLYRSKKNYKFLYPALLCFLIAVDSQPAGLLLVPFFVLHILYYNRKKWLFSLVPIIVFFQQQLSVFGIFSRTTAATVIASADTAAIQILPALYLREYLNFAVNMKYLLLFFVPGAIWAFFRNKRLTLLLLIPSFLLLSGIIFLDIFALRYAYFFAFPLILFSSLLLSFLLEKYGKIFVIVILLVLLIPSNLFFPFNYVTMVKPTQGSFNDFSAPEIDVKNIPPELLSELKEPSSVIITHYSPPVEWYIKKPSFVLDFSMSGKSSSSIDVNGIDVYSGAPVLDSNSVSKPYYFIEQFFATSKLSSGRRALFQSIVSGCEKKFSNNDIVVYYCS
ncbi:MAG: glycosyltransferase family 39 protein [archaeon]